MDALCRLMASVWFGMNKGALNMSDGEMAEFVATIDVVPQYPLESQEDSRRFARVSRQVSRVDGGSHILCVAFTRRDVCIMQPTKVVCLCRTTTHHSSQWDEIGQCGHSTLKLFGHLWVTSVHN